MTEKLTLLSSFFRDKDGKVAMWQKPNAPLIAWLSFAVLSHLLTAEAWRTYAHGFSKAALIIWAILEIYSGASPFRRVLGLLILVLNIGSLW